MQMSVFIDKNELFYLNGITGLPGREGNVFAYRISEKRLKVIKYTHSISIFLSILVMALALYIFLTHSATEFTYIHLMFVNFINIIAIMLVNCTNAVVRIETKEMIGERIVSFIFYGAFSFVLFASFVVLVFYNMRNHNVSVVIISLVLASSIFFLSRAIAWCRR
jgi:hypothetical protein